MCLLTQVTYFRTMLNMGIFKQKFVVIDFNYYVFSCEIYIPTMLEIKYSLLIYHLNINEMYKIILN